MARISHALASRNTSKESPYRISPESKTVTKKTKDDMDADSKARFQLDLSKVAQALNRLSDLTLDRKNWRRIVRRVVQY